jgi:hypothetical protein
VEIPQPFTSGLAPRLPAPLHAVFGYQMANQIFGRPVRKSGAEGIVGAGVTSVVGVFQFALYVGPPPIGWRETREGFPQRG